MNSSLCPHPRDLGFLVKFWGDFIAFDADGDTGKNRIIPKHGGHDWGKREFHDAYEQNAVDSAHLTSHGSFGK
jgi:hypothetical protein